MAKKSSSFLDAFKGLTQKKPTKDKDINKYEKILEETPDDRNALNALGDLHAKRGDAAKACEYYLQVGGLYAKDGFTLKAIAVYKKAQRAQPNVVHTYVDLADLYVQKGLIGEAKSNYLTAAEMHAAAGAKHESLDIYRKIADLDPDNINIRTKLAAMYEKEEFLEDAAIIYAEIGDALVNEHLEDAQKHYQRAMELQPENQDILSRIGYAYADQDLRPEAAEIFEILLTLDPKNIDYQEQLEELQEEAAPQESVSDVIASDTSLASDGSALTFSEDELSSLNFGAPAEPALDASVMADDNLLNMPLTGVNDDANANEPSLPSADDHVLDFQIGDQDGIVLQEDLTTAEEEPSQPEMSLNLSLDGADSGAEPAPPSAQPPSASPSDTSGYFDLASRLDTAVQIGREFDTSQQSSASPAPVAHNLKVEAPESIANSEISDIIKEFKQGVLEEVGTEDYETHYELGISYKEMSLLDDAIEELKLAALEPTKFVECQGVIGLCYIEKGDYAQAIQAFNEARSRIDKKSDEYQDITYQIAVSYEESDRIEEAANELQVLYQLQPNYRDVKQRLKRLMR
jgi:tetratricopeptide (TPR) repeat protein